MAAMSAAMMLDTGCANQAPLSSKIGGNMKMNGMRSKIWRDSDKKIDVFACPILWK